MLPTEPFGYLVNDLLFTQLDHLAGMPADRPAGQFGEEHPNA